MNFTFHGYLTFLINFFLTKIPNFPNFSKLVTFSKPWSDHWKPRLSYGNKTFTFGKKWHRGNGQKFFNQKREFELTRRKIRPTRNIFDPRIWTPEKNFELWDKSFDPQKKKKDPWGYEPPKTSNPGDPPGHEIHET